MLIDGLITFLTTNVPLTGGYSEHVLPRGYELPAAALHRYAGNQEYQMDGPTEVSEDQIQLDIYGKTAAECRASTDSVRAALISFSGALPDGTVVQACYLERDMDMPFLPNADQKGLAFRSILGFRIVTARV